MNRHLNQAFATISVLLGLLAAVPAQGATATEVSRSDWAGSVSLPSYVKMYIYLPKKLATKPPILVSAHSCGSSASGQLDNIPKSVAKADSNGFIIILPDNPGQNCWDVGSDKSLKHDGGGDTQAVAQMVKYAITKYGADTTRIYIMGGSSGAMMTQAMLAVYPDLFKAGHARAGVPAGCWAVDYDKGTSRQWSDPCAKGQVTHTAKEWGDIVRAMYPGYSGPRPRVQLVQGGSDTTISPKNMDESIKEWTNVLGLSTDPTSKDTGHKGDVSTYDRRFWSSSCNYTVLEAWVAPGQGHSMGYEETAMLTFFGLDAAVGGPDPEDAACLGDAGAPSTGGVGGGTGGMTGAGGGTSGRDGGPGGRDAGVPGTGGVPPSGGSTGSGGAVATGGRSGTGGSGVPAGGGTSGSTAKGGASGGGASGGSSGSGGINAKGGSSGSGSETKTGGSSGSGGSSTKGSTGGSTTGGSGGCSVGDRSSSTAKFATLLLVAVALVVRRRRTRR